MIVVFLQTIFIAFSLAMDAVSASISGGIKSKSPKVSNAFKVAAFFGGFQAAMPIVGWSIGEALKGYISAIDHWIAFILLVFIGLKMINEALDKESIRKDIFQTRTLVMLSLATSIDALIVGITLPLIKMPFVISISIIGIVTFILSFGGFLFGRKLGMLFGKRIEILGGLSLILIGLKILIEHLII